MGTSSSINTKDMSPAGAKAMEEITIFLKLMPPDAEHKVIAQDKIGEWPFAIKLEKLQTKGRDKSNREEDEYEEDGEEEEDIDDDDGVPRRLSEMYKSSSPFMSSTLIMTLFIVSITVCMQFIYVHYLR